MYIYFNNVDLSTDLSTHQCLFMESQAVSLKPHSNTMKEALSLFPLYRWEMKALVLNMTGAGFTRLLWVAASAWPKGHEEASVIMLWT